MNSFAYASARTLDGAQSLIAGESTARYLAGGIDLLGELKEGLSAPKLLVDIKSLPDTRRIAIEGATLRIGANVTIAEIAASPEIRQLHPGLAQAAAEVGSPQIRQAATLGGNLAQHSRCWYYRNKDVPCLKKGGATCFAREGLNKFHALFSGNPCVSPLVSNLAVALTALQATVRVRAAKGGAEKRLTLPELYAPAWENPLSHHAIASGDLILGVEIPAAAGKSAYLQASERSDFDWALVSCAAAATLDPAGKLAAPRVALGAISPVPHRSDAVDTLLASRPLDAALAAEAAELLLRDAKPLADNGYKIPIAQALVRRALEKLLA